jgi:hypothetical protein
MEATKAGHDKPEILSRMAVSAIAKIFGVTQPRYLGKERMGRRYWEGRPWIIPACMIVLGWLRGDEAVVKLMRVWPLMTLYDMKHEYSKLQILYEPLAAFLKTAVARGDEGWILTLEEVNNITAQRAGGKGSKGPRVVEIQVQRRH